MEILLFVLVFLIGIFVGFLVKGYLQYRAGYNGAILITEEADRKLYSLMLDDYPEKIEFKKEVVLKVVASEEKSNRK